MLPKEKNTILFVDDDIESLRLYKRKFGSYYVVRTADSGMAALDILSDEWVDVIISDLHMPGMDGLLLLEKAREVNPSMLRVIITAYDDYEWIVDGLNRGIINHTFKKPLEACFR